MTTIERFQPDQARPPATTSTASTAGRSALHASDAAARTAEAYRRRYLAERERARTFGIAARTERELAQRLRPMTDLGWRLLEDRRWPGTRHGNIDMLLVGPGGVLVIDVKSWAEPDVIDGHLFRGQAQADDEVAKVLGQAEIVDDVTSALGLAPSEVIPALVFMHQRGTDLRLGRVHLLDEHSIVPWAVSRGNRLSAEHVEDLVQLLDTALAPYEVSSTNRCDEADEAGPSGRHVSRDQFEQDLLLDVAALESALRAGLDRAPVEDWMTFLHPEQARVVRRLGAGASRVRGPAGTGKTVVALHRTAFVAETLDGPILFTTFVKTLPPVLENLYRRLAPGSGDRVEFTHLHAWARRFLEQRGRHVTLDPRFADAALNRAWGRHGRGSYLDELGTGREYWKDEIEYVIKGRGITDFAEYAALRRVGRRTRLLPAHRETVWAMYEDYEQQLRDADVYDFTDLLALALDELRYRPLETPYSAVIADEVQDLNCQAVRLLAEIAQNGDRLLLIGDGQQQVYPGGFTLSEAGVSVNGRSTVFRVNYRNAEEVLAAAGRVVVDDEFEDLDAHTEAGRRETFSARAGGRSWESEVASPETLRERAVGQIRGLVESGHDRGGIALLCATNAEAERYLTLLDEAGIAAIPLAKYVGEPVDAVKVGTVQRAKGLEFKDVVCPVHPRATAPVRSAEAAREETERENRTLFVAMTRARDTVWVGRVA